MKTRFLFSGIAVLVVVGLAAPAFAQTNALYVPNKGSDTVSVIDTDANTVIEVIDLVALTGSTKGPAAVVTTLDGKKAYVVSEVEGGVVVINTQDGSVRTFVDFGNSGGNPLAAAISPDGSTVWVTELFGERLVAVDTTTDTLGPILPITCPAGDPRCAAAGFGQFPLGLGVAPTTVDATGQSGELWVTVQAPGRVEVFDFGPNPGDLVSAPRSSDPVRARSSSRPRGRMPAWRTYPTSAYSEARVSPIRSPVSPPKSRPPRRPAPGP